MAYTCKSHQSLREFRTEILAELEAAIIEECCLLASLPVHSLASLYMPEPHAQDGATQSGLDSPASIHNQDI